MSARFWLIRCDACDGAGSYVATVGMPGPDDREYRCEECHGEGVVEAEEATPGQVADGITIRDGRREKQLELECALTLLAPDVPPKKAPRCATCKRAMRVPLHGVAPVRCERCQSDRDEAMAEDEAERRRDAEEACVP